MWRTLAALTTATPPPPATAATPFTMLVRAVARCVGGMRGFRRIHRRNLDLCARLLRLARGARRAGLGFAGLTRLALAAAITAFAVAARFANHVVALSITGLAVTPCFAWLPLAPSLTMLAVLAVGRSLRFDGALTRAANRVACTHILALALAVPLVTVLTFAPRFGSPPVTCSVAAPLWTCFARAFAR